MSAVQKAPQLNIWSAEEWIDRMFPFEAWPHNLDLSEATKRVAVLALARGVALSGSIDQALLAKAARGFWCADDPGPIDPELVSPVQLNALARAGIITLDDADQYWAEWADWAAVDWSSDREGPRRRTVAHAARGRTAGVARRCRPERRSARSTPGGIASASTVVAAGSRSPADGRQRR